MEWTKEKPKKPGAYRLRIGGAESTVTVAPSFDGRVWISVPGKHILDVRIAPVDNEDAEWMGPLGTE